MSQSGAPVIGASIAISSDKNYRKTFDFINEVEHKASEDGDWESAFIAMCQHANTLRAELQEALSARGDTERLDWLETLPCGITINADRDHQARLMTRQQPGYLRDFIDEVKRSYVVVCTKEKK